jgi:tetratricopeptide (TPR) repeat protein
MALAAAADAATGGAPTADPAVPAQTAQQQFDAADAAFASQDCAKALPLFESLAMRPGLARNTHVQAIIHVRKGSCLVQMRRLDQAADELVAGVGALDPEDGGNRSELATAHLALGKLAYLTFQYEAATREFQTALGLTEGVKRFEPLLWLSRSALFDEGTVASAASEEALRLATTNPGSDKESVAALRSLHARALLNHGQQAVAYRELQDALKAQGGLTTRVSLVDVITRSDLALAAMLTGKKEDARKYLAYTGAGRFEKSPFATAVAMDAPPCGGRANLQPDDFAIVEFSLRDDGSVANVEPIYVPGGAAVAAEFAGAVSGWSWLARDAAKIPAFFRLVTRVELRCSTGSRHPDVLQQLKPVLDGWLAQRRLPGVPTAPTQAAIVAEAKATLARTTPPANEADVLGPMMALATSPILLPQERSHWFQQARDVAAAAGAPVAALTWFDVNSFVGMRYADGGSRKYRERLRELLARPAVAADARSAATLRLLIAEPQYGSPPPSDALQLLKATANDPQLTEFDPLKAGAFVRLATLQAASGDLESARRSYDSSGLSDQQCSLVDAAPALRRSGGSQESFPNEALVWGFEGWVYVEFDIEADGKTTRQRPIVAYPPLVFEDSALRTIRATRYDQTYRPGGAIGCGGKRTTVTYKLYH